MSLLQRCFQNRATSWEWLSEGCITQMTEILRSTPELRLLIIVVATVIGEVGNFVPPFSKQIIEDALVFRSEEKKKLFLSTCLKMCLFWSRQSKFKWLLMWNQCQKSRQLFCSLGRKKAFQWSNGAIWNILSQCKIQLLLTDFYIINK